MLGDGESVRQWGFDRSIQDDANLHQLQHTKFRLPGSFADPFRRFPLFDHQDWLPRPPLVVTFPDIPPVAATSPHIVAVVVAQQFHLPSCRPHARFIGQSLFGRDVSSKQSGTVHAPILPPSTSSTVVLSLPDIPSPSRGGPVSRVVSLNHSRAMLHQGNWAT